MHLKCDPLMRIAFTQKDAITQDLIDQCWGSTIEKGDLDLSVSHSIKGCHQVELPLDLLHSGQFGIQQHGDIHITCWMGPTTSDGPKQVCGDHILLLGQGGRHSLPIHVDASVGPIGWARLKRSVVHCQRNDLLYLAIRAARTTAPLWSIVARHDLSGKSPRHPFGQLAD